MGWLRDLLGGLEGGSKGDDCHVFVHDVLVPFAIGFGVGKEVDELGKDFFPPIAEEFFTH